MTTNEVLSLINAARKESGMRPLKKMPKGQRESFHSCPVAKALGVEAVTKWSVIDSNEDRIKACQEAWGMPQRESRPYGWRVTMPPALQTFVEEFDNALYPELMS